MIRYAFGVAALITFGGPAAAEEFKAKYAAQDWGMPGTGAASLKTSEISTSRNGTNSAGCTTNLQRR